MATLTTKYNLGDKVWIIHDNCVSRLVHCDICHREGTVTIGSESFTCPKCEGKSRHPQWVGRRWTPWVSGRIGQIRLEVNEPTMTDGRDEIHYMLDSTGIGSGSLWKESDIYSTREEAEAECAVRNGSKVFDDDPA